MDREPQPLQASECLKVVRDTAQTVAARCGFGSFLGDPVWDEKNRKWLFSLFGRLPGDLGTIGPVGEIQVDESGELRSFMRSSKEHIAELLKEQRAQFGMISLARVPKQRRY